MHVQGTCGSMRKDMRNGACTEACVGAWDGRMGWGVEIGDRLRFARGVQWHTIYSYGLYGYVVMAYTVMDYMVM